MASIVELVAVFSTYRENYYEISLKPLVIVDDTADEADHGTRTGLWCEDLRTRDRSPGGCGRLGLVTGWGRDTALRWGNWPLHQSPIGGGHTHPQSQ